MLHYNLDSQTYGAIRFKPVMPATLGKWLMPGSQPYSAEGAFGNIFLQRVNAGWVQFFYTVCIIKEDVALDFRIPKRLWVAQIALKNECRFDIGLEPVCLKQGQLNIMRAPQPGTFYMERGNEYETISISCDAVQLRQLLTFFPNLPSFERRSNSLRLQLLFRKHRWIDAQLLNIIDHLLHCSYRGNLRRLYLNYNVRELLLLILNRQKTRHNNQQEVNDHTLELINEAKYLIEAGFGQPMTLHKIARQLGINEVKLQSGLRQMFGTRIAGYPSG